MDQVARIGLADITLDVAMISVWGIYSERVQDAVSLAAQHGVKLTEDELIELGTFWVTAWQLADSDWYKGMKCPICRAVIEVRRHRDLCECFQLKRVGKYVDYDVPGRIKELAEADPAGWRERIAEAFQCRTCKAVKDIELGKIADRYNQGKPWNTPFFCTPCATAYKEQKRALTVYEVPPKRLPAPDIPALEADLGDTKQCTQ